MKKLTNDELTTAILHITKHRGSVIETVEEDAKKSDDELSLKDYFGIGGYQYIR